MNMTECTRLEKQPYLVIEELDPKYTHSLMKASLIEPLLRSRRPWIRRVHVIQFSEQGCYVGKNFGRNPHYMVPYDSYEKTIGRRCLLFDIPVVVYPLKKTISHSDLLICFNFGRNKDPQLLCPETRFINDLLVNMKEVIRSTKQGNEIVNKVGVHSVVGLHNNNESFGGVVEEDNVSSRVDNDTTSMQDVIRGARQVHHGFSSNYSLSRLPKEQGGMVSPRIMGGYVPLACVPLFVGMTKLGDAMYSHDCSRKLRHDDVSERLYADGRRNDRFARIIHCDNRIEALTCSETEEGGAILNIHVDTNNDDTAIGRLGNYNYVICAWHYVTLPDNRLKRIAILAYSRRSVGDLFTREDQCRLFFDKTMSPWLRQLPVWRKQTSPGRDIFLRNYYGLSATVGNAGELNFPPTINKHATYLSAFVDAGNRLRHGYEKVNKKEMSVEKYLEAVLPIVFSNSALPYVTVVDRIIGDTECVRRMAGTNLTVLFREILEEQFKSIRSGGQPRHQPTFNKDPSDLWIFESLLILRQAVRECRSNTRFSFQCLNQILKKINGVGDLLGQHLAHVMALSLLIPAKFGAGAVVCTGTVTASRLISEHGIKKSSFNCLMEYTCLEYNWLPYMAESGLCKVGQHPNVRFRDAIYPTQESVYWITMVQDNYRVMRLNRKMTGGGAVTCPRQLTLDMAKVEKHNSSSISSMRVILENWWITRSNMDFKAIQARYAEPTRDRLSKDSEKGNRNRKRGLDTCVPVANKKIDWRCLDDREIREFSDDFCSKLRSAAIQLYRKHQDELFGNKSSSQRHSLDLRLIHNMGKLYSSTRTPRYESRRRTVPGLFKSVTNLLSLGVQVYQINDLFILTQEVTRGTFLLQTPSHVGGVILLVEVITLESNKNTSRFSVNGGTLFGCQAHLIDRHRRKGETHRTLQTWTLGRQGDRCLAVQSSEGCFKLRSVVDNDISPDILGFTNKKDAKRSMLWYLLTMKDHLDWINMSIPSELWRPATNNTSEIPESCALYVIISIGNMGNGKGEVLCVLGTSPGNRTVFVKMEAHNRIFALPVISKSNLLGKCTKGIPMDNEKQGSIVGCDSEPVPVKCVLTSRRRRTAVLAVPSEIDPFTGNKSATSREIMDHSIVKWQRVWSQVLDGWRTSMVVRPTGTSMDRYWHPPGTSTECGSIRSPKDLQDFLNYSSRTLTEEENGDPNFVRLLHEWNGR